MSPEISVYLNISPTIKPGRFEIRLGMRTRVIQTQVAQGKDR
jgi:hypothetical protein